ncbi:unnamed protein product [Protopolystoma xenopodis]|uniref:Uncharacterized protein n=1 Tax=Protopolystoma xenopodis TaxID=117903 RepID=A0A3S5CHX7_9PLAT|nr:unnamed protein product [Protopolystoma xenopodis]
MAQASILILISFLNFSLSCPLPNTPGEHPYTPSHLSHSCRPVEWPSPGVLPAKYALIQSDWGLWRGGRGGTVPVPNPLCSSIHHTFPFGRSHVDRSRSIGSAGSCPDRQAIRRAGICVWGRHLLGAAHPLAFDGLAVKISQTGSTEFVLLEPLAQPTQFARLKWA